MEVFGGPRQQRPLDTVSHPRLQRASPVNLQSKAGKEATKELLLISDMYTALYQRYNRELLATGKISREAVAMRKEIDKRAERIYK